MICVKYATIHTGQNLEVTMWDKLKGFKTIIVALLALAVSILSGAELTDFLLSIGIEGAAETVGTILAVLMIILRFLTTGPIGEGRHVE